MADKSAVATAYAEVRADLSKLPNDMAKIPSLMKRMVSTQGLNAVRDILTGNISGGLVSIVTRGYELQAQKLRDIAKAAGEAKKKLEEMAAVHEQQAGDKTKSQGYRDAHASKAQALREAAARQGARADGFGQKADAVSGIGNSLGGKVALAAKVGIAGIAAVAAVAAAYFATTVAAAHKATADLKTAQIIRATGEAAGWTAKQLEHMGENLRQNSSFSHDKIAGAQQALLTRPNIKGDQFKRALNTAGDVAAAQGSDLASTAAEIGDLLADPLKAAEGGLEKYGVLLNATEQGIIRNAVASRDWAKAQNIVLKHLDGFKGSAKEAGETGAGGFEKLKNSLLNAATVVGGLNGDIGKLAARVANAVDAFMNLQIVKDVLKVSTEIFKLISGITFIEMAVEALGDSFSGWGDQVSEIYHNIRDQFIELWDGAKSVFKEAWDWMLGYIQPIWDAIKAHITAVLDEISLLTTDFKLTAQYVWVGIQLAAQQTWDFLKSFAQNIPEYFTAAWAAIVKGAEVAWDNVKGIFKGEGLGKNIADEMGKAFADSLKAQGVDIRDSEAVKELKAQLMDLRGQMEAKREAKRAARAAGKDEDTPGKGTDYKNTKPFKFEFVGFEEMSKKIQSSLFPSEQIQLAKAGVAAAEKAVDNGVKANGFLEDIAKKVGKNGLAP